MEKFEVFDNDRLPLKKFYSYGEKRNLGENRIASHICIFNKKGQMLISQRQSDMKSCPNMWDFSSGGGATGNENGRQCAQRELKEELGVDYDFSKVRASFTFNSENEFDDYFIIDLNLDEKKLKLQKEEVKNVKWAEKTEILRLLKEKQFVPYKKSLVELIFDYKNQRNSFKH